MHKYKTGLTQEELDGVKTFYHIDIRKFLKELKEYSSFNEGDILIAHTQDDWDNDGNPIAWKPVEMRAGNVPQKWCVVLKDADGLVYAKKITAKGQLSKITELITMSEYKFAVDPALAESIILDDEAGYDPDTMAKALKQHKKDAKKYNKTIQIKLGSYDQISQWIKTLKKGDVFWSMNCPSDRNPKKCKVKRKKYPFVDTTIGTQGWSDRNDSYHNHEYTAAGMSKYAEVIVDQTWYGSTEESSWEINEFLISPIYSKKPKTYDMDIK